MTPELAALLGFCAGYIACNSLWQFLYRLNMKLLIGQRELINEQGDLIDKLKALAFGGDA